MRTLLPFARSWSWPMGSIARDLEAAFAADPFNDADLFGDLFPIASRYWRETDRFEMRETDHHYLVSTDLPGIKREDLNIEIKNQNLIVSAERKEVSQSKEAKTYGKISRAIALPEDANLENVEAHYEDGVLKIAVEKKKEATAKVIPIQPGKANFFEALSESQSSPLKAVKDPP